MQNPKAILISVVILGAVIAVWFYTRQDYSPDSVYQDSQLSQLPQQEEISHVPLGATAENLFYWYHNDRYNFSIKLPKIVSASSCIPVEYNGQKLFSGNMAPIFYSGRQLFRSGVATTTLIVVNKNDGVIIKKKYFQTSLYSGNLYIGEDGTYYHDACEEVTESMDIGWVGWYVFIDTVSDSPSLLKFVRTHTANDCEIGEARTTDYVGTFDVPIIQNGDLGEGCFLGARYSLKYSPQTRRAAYWVIGQDTTFHLAGQEEAHIFPTGSWGMDEIMQKSFHFGGI